MLFIKREPGVGYLDNYLWIPKTKANDRQIQSTFTIMGSGRNAGFIQAWWEELHHYRVPRNYVNPETLRSLPFPVVDARVRSFPPVQLQSRVILDGREPSKTYQNDGARALLSAQDGILSLRCGAGKTVVALHAASLLQVPVLVVVHEEGLVNQWVDEIVTHLGVNEKDIGFLGGSRGGTKMNRWKKSITIGLVQTLARRAKDGNLPPEILLHFGVVIVDECHMVGAPMINQAIHPFHGRRWGLSATPARDDGFDPLIKYTLGPVVYSYLMPDLRTTVHFQQLTTTIPDRDWKQVSDVTSEFHFKKCFVYLSGRHDRTDEIVEYVQAALNSGRQVLLLTGSKDMTYELGKRFPQGGVINGDIKGDERWRRTQTCNPVIALTKLGQQALNKPELDTAFLLEPIAKESMQQQVIGRILRRFSGKMDPMFVVFEDAGIQGMKSLCGKMKRNFLRWPAAKGGRIPFKVYPPRNRKRGIL